MLKFRRLVGDEGFWSLLLRIFWVGGEESLVLSCKRDKNRYIIQGFAERRMCREMRNSEGDENEKSFQKFDSSSKTVLEFKAQLIAAKSGKQRKTSV